MFLVDEISLADDSVLERLNSLLGKLPSHIKRDVGHSMPSCNQWCVGVPTPG